MYATFPSSVHGAAVVWATAKEAVADLLLDRSYALSPEKLKCKELEGELRLLHTIAKLKVEAQGAHPEAPGSK